MKICHWILHMRCLEQTWQHEEFFDAILVIAEGMDDFTSSKGHS